MIEGFNKSQSEYEVQIQSINYGRIDNQVIQATAAGEGPDIINVYSDLLPTHIAAKTIVPLDAYVSKMSAAEQNDFVMPLKQFQDGGKQMAHASRPVLGARACHVEGRLQTVVRTLPRRL